MPSQQPHGDRVATVPAASAKPTQQPHADRVATGPAASTSAQSSEDSEAEDYLRSKYSSYNLRCMRRGTKDIMTYKQYVDNIYVAHDRQPAKLVQHLSMACMFCH